MMGMPMEGRQELSKAEAEGLPDGVHVWIVWDGGNGPHRYELQRSYGRMRVVHPGVQGTRRLGAWITDEARQIWLENPYGSVGE